MSSETKPRSVRLRERAWILLVFGVLLVWLVGFGGLGSDAAAWKAIGVVGVVGGVGMVVGAIWLFTNRRR